MTLQKTNTPGWLKDKKTNMIIPQNIDEKVRQVQLGRQRFREMQQLMRDVATLKEQVKELQESTKWIIRYEGGISSEPWEKCACGYTNTVCESVRGEKGLRR